MDHSYLLLLLFLGAAAVVNGGMTTVSSKAGGTSCTSPFHDVGGRCLYVDVSNTGSWDTMRTHCRSLGGDLAILNDAEVYSSLIRYIHGSGFPELQYWIGATDEAQEGLWLWVNQEPVQMGTPYWANYGCSNLQMPTGGTAENCLCLDNTYHLYFNDGICSQTLHAICEQ
ncbi:C-type lectin domain family 17, member A-like [Procambarus clarkii]|uniref:C-type lectin domain family 17, member A-like n=1 Tax=Procambarus clarkii TaxID=6728 RepID=UPI0037444786